MLQQTRITMMLPVKDLQRAREFYEDRLGFVAGELRADGKFAYDCDGLTIALFPKDGGTRADHTALSFEVPDIAAAIADLQQRGVTFEDYDFPGLRTEAHVCVLGAEKAAWFLDTEGNCLCLHENLR